MNSTAYYSTSIDKVLSQLKTDPNKGLSQQTAQKKLEEQGLNKLPKHKQRTVLKMVISQLSSPLVYVLLIGVALSAFFGEWVDAGAISIAMFVSVIVGVWQEYKSSNIFDKLSENLEHYAIVLRNGEKKEIRSKNLVPGDIVFLEMGRDVPADCRILQSKDLAINEASLTGESAAVDKNTEQLAEGTPLADRSNMVFMGTAVVEGSGKAVVVKTGESTEFGQIADLVQKTESQKTALQEKMAVLAKYLSLLVLFSGIVIVVVGLLQNRNVEQTIITSIAVSVAAIPEGLVPATSIILAISANKIFGRKGLVKRLIAAETLGSVTVICADKTGTLTRGEMVVHKVANLEGQVFFTESGVDEERTTLSDRQIDFLVHPLLFANEAIPEKLGKNLAQIKLIGNPTDKAVMLAGIKLANVPSTILDQHKRLANIQFDSERKYLASFHQDIVYVAGAREVVFDMCSLTGDEKKQYIEKEEEFAAKGYRIVGLAQKNISPSKDLKGLSEDELEQIIGNNAQFLGLIVIRDPIRNDVLDSLKVTRKAGIRPILATGDQLLTAKAVAEALEFDTSDKAVVDGKKLDRLSEEKFRQRVEDIEVYARVTPKHKIRIIKAWQNKGEIIAMTGDGVNDAPALKRANIGVAVASGTDVAKEAADLVLLDNSFTVITEAVRQGRVAFDNMRKTVIFLLSDSFTEIGLILSSLLLNTALPITGLQILWINFVEDVFPGIALGFEPGEDNVMKRDPVPRTQPLVDSFARKVTGVIALTGVLLALITFLVGRYALDFNLGLSQTLTFAIVGANSLVYVFSIKNFRKSIFKANILSNKQLNRAVLVGLILLISALYIPFLNSILGTVPLPLWGYLPVLLIPILQVFAIELIKKREFRT